MTPTAYLRLRDMLQNAGRPALVVDELRFGEIDRVVFAAVATTVGALARFGLEIERFRESLDLQKRRKKLKAASVLRGRDAAALGPIVERLFASASVGYWATAESYLRRERDCRDGPAVRALDGRQLNGPETPLVDFIVAEGARRFERMGLWRLDAFVDRSVQNGLHLGEADKFDVFEADQGAAVLREGKSELIGFGTRRRIFALTPEIEWYGDLLLVGDLAAHLWGHAPNTVARLEDPKLEHGFDLVGSCSGQRVIEQLRIARQSGSRVIVPQRPRSGPRASRNTGNDFAVKVERHRTALHAVWDGQALRELVAGAEGPQRLRRLLASRDQGVGAEGEHPGRHQHRATTD